VRCGSFSRLAGRRQRPWQGWSGLEQGPIGNGHTSNRVGCARKACAERAGGCPDIVGCHWRGSSPAARWNSLRRRYERRHKPSD
jgi:hypothetical protein